MFLTGQKRAYYYIQGNSLNLQVSKYLFTTEVSCSELALKIRGLWATIDQNTLSVMFRDFQNAWYAKILEMNTLIRGL